jgi:hypothetical protein
LPNSSRGLTVHPLILLLLAYLVAIHPKERHALALIFNTDAQLHAVDLQAGIKRARERIPDRLPARAEGWPEIAAVDWNGRRMHDHTTNTNTAVAVGGKVKFLRRTWWRWRVGQFSCLTHCEHEGRRHDGISLRLGHFSRGNLDNRRPALL